MMYMFCYSEFSVKILELVLKFLHLLHLSFRYECLCEVLNVVFSIEILRVHDIRGDFRLERSFYLFHEQFLKIQISKKGMF